MATILVAPNTPAKDFGDLQPLVDALRHDNDVTSASNAFASNITTFADTGTDVRVMDTTLDELKKELGFGTKDPKESTENKRAPSSTAVTVLPYDRAAAKDNYNLLMEANTMVQLYTSIESKDKRAKRGHPEPYDITIPKEAAQAFADQASSAFTAMSDALTGFFNYSSGAQQTMDRTVLKAELHLEFLQEIFKGFNLGKDALAALDGVLTKFVEAVSKISVTTEGTNNTVDHSLRILQCSKMNITGDDSDPEYVYQPRVKIVYMRISNDSWLWATKKMEISKAKFHMQYTVADFDLNVNKFKNYKPTLEKVWRQLSGASLEEYSRQSTGKPLFEDK